MIVAASPTRCTDTRSRHGILLVLTLLATLTWAAVEPVQAAAFEQRNFPNELTRTRYLDIIDELRCLVCQNQNIADSDADLATDLRNKVYELLLDERSDTEIMHYMVERYGDFVLYRPPVKAVTIGLWAGPILMLGLGLGLLWRHLRASVARETALSPEERTRLDRVTGQLENPRTRT